MGDSEIPFPLISGQYISAIENGKRVFYQVSKQPRYFDFSQDYELAPSASLSDQAFTLGSGSGAINAFQTPYLKEWVTWIDNDDLGVSWNISNTAMNKVQGYTKPLTIYTSPYGSVSFPMFNFKNSTGNVTYTLQNLSATDTIAGTIHVLMYDYMIVPFSGSVPQYYTDIEYVSGEQS